MRNLIKADLRRILKKPSIYIWLAVTFVFLFIFTGLSDYTEETVHDEIMVLKYTLTFLTTLPVFLAVYGDEMKCGSMQCIIGRGISRSRVIIAKFLDCVILAAPFILMAIFTISLRNFILNVGTTPTQDMSIISFILILYLKAIGYFAIASFFVFLSWSTAPGVVALITMTAILGNSLQAIQMLMNRPIYDFYYDGLLDAAYANMEAGNVGYQIIPALLIYVCGALIITILVFNKKEIEF